MSYLSGEALILAEVQSCSGFDANNTSRGNWLVLNRGGGDHYAILRPGAFETEWITYTKYLARYTTVIEIWQRYKDDATTKTNLYGHIANIMALMTTPRIGDTTNVISDSSITGAAEPVERWTKDGGPVWLTWEVQFRWTEEIEVTFSS